MTPPNQLTPAELRRLRYVAPEAWPPTVKAECVRALARARLEAQRREDEAAARGWRRLVTEHPEAEILVLDRQPAPVPPPHPAKVAIASLVTLLVLGGALGLVFAACAQAYRWAVEP